MAEHTKGRLHVGFSDPKEIMGEDSINVAFSVGRSEYKNQFNARRLVQCWNSHEALVEALEKLRSYNEDVLFGRINYRPADHIRVVDSALKLAQE